MRTKLIIQLLFVVQFICVFTACKKFVEIDPPRTEQVSRSVFLDEATANAAVANLYRKLKANQFSNGGYRSVSFTKSLAADQVIPMIVTDIQKEFANCSVHPTNEILTTHWQEIYTGIYAANLILEGLESSKNILEAKKNQFEGEAKFIRAFYYFYLVNLWGDVPLVLTTNYQINTNVAKSFKADIQNQIVIDLKEAQSLLPEDYATDNNERVRASKGVASALLSRVYLYSENWQDAEIEASSVIDNSSLYVLETELTDVFKSTSKEAIFQLWKKSNQFPDDLFTYVSFFAGELNPNFAASFDASDLRLAKWINYNGQSYFPDKYKLIIPSPDYSTVFRLAEQYLIRAEARAHLDKLTGANSAETDINVIRNRAGLSPTSASSQTDLLSEIEAQRQFELFDEWGHRWFDLIRTGKANEVLGSIKPDWESYKLLLPIPQSQIDADPAMKNAQNEGYH